MIENFQNLKFFVKKNIFRSKFPPTKISVTVKNLTTWNFEIFLCNQNFVMNFCVLRSKWRLIENYCPVSGKVSTLFSFQGVECYCNIRKAIAALCLVRSQLYSQFRVKAYCNVKKITAALCLGRSQPYSHLMVETHCNIRKVTAALCLVRSQPYSDFRVEAYWCEKSDCCPVSGKVETIYWLLHYNNRNEGFLKVSRKVDRQQVTNGKESYYPGLRPNTEQQQSLFLHCNMFLPGSVSTLNWE